MVFAGGDIGTGAATVVLAMGAGRRSAREIACRRGLLELVRAPFCGYTTGSGHGSEPVFLCLKRPSFVITQLPDPRAGSF